MKTTIINTAVLAGLLAAGPAWAVSKHMVQKEVKDIQDAATEIEPNNPDLASKLKDLAQREQAVSESGARESASQDKTDAAILKDGANAVRSTRPDLAKKLDKYASHETRESKMHHGMRGTSGSSSGSMQQENQQETTPPPSNPGY